MRGLQMELRRLRYNKKFSYSFYLLRNRSRNVRTSSLPRGRCLDLQGSFHTPRYILSVDKRPHRFNFDSRTQQPSPSFAREYAATNCATVTDAELSYHGSYTRDTDDVCIDETNGSPERDIEKNAGQVIHRLLLAEKTPKDISPFRQYFYSQSLTPAHVLHLRSLSVLLRGFLNSPSRILPLQPCTSSTRVVHNLAVEADLWVWRYNDKDAEDCSFYLVKKENIDYTGATASLMEKDLPMLTEDGLQDALDLLNNGSFPGFDTVVLQNHWPMLLNFCDFQAGAMPSLMVQLQDHEAEIHAEEVPSNAIINKLTIYNDHHDQPITIESSSSVPESLGKDFAQMIVRYCQQLQGRATARPSISLRFRPDEDYLSPGEFLQKAASVLGYGGVNYHSDIDPVLFEATGLEFWRSDITFGGRVNTKATAVWLHRKSARILSTMRACLELKPRLEEAYKSERILPQEYRIFAKHWGEEVVVTSKLGNEVSERRIDVPINVADETIARMVRALSDLREHGFLPLDGHQFDPEVYRKKETWSHRLSRNKWMDQKLQADREFSKSKSSISTERKLLPVMREEVSDEILTTIEANDITIITAATGSGKTTQIPQLLWDHYIDAGNGSLCSIICTQPRRVSTISVAKRVAFERHQSVGEEVGYQVRFDDKAPGSRRGINYVTSGLFLRILESDHRDSLASYSHVILDEVHTRDIDTDLILTALKNLMAEKKTKLPKIVLMSASIDAEYFADYFKDLDVSMKVSCINVPGVTFPVTTTRLQDLVPLLEAEQPDEFSILMQNKRAASYIQSQCSLALEAKEAEEEVSIGDEDMLTPATEGLDDLYVPTPLIPLVINHVSRTSGSGDILVFLPGLSEIEDVEERLLSNSVLGYDFSDTRHFKIFKLHSALYETNFDVFEPVRPGCRRIVLATNIAETSLTLPNVKFVIDTGLSRQNFHEQAMQSGQLKLVWISKAEVTQRRGRVGRTQPGEYFALYSDDQYNNMIERPQPELTRTSLTQIVLRVQESSAFKAAPTPESPLTDMDPSSPGAILLTAPSAPDRSKILAAGQQLRNLKAVTDSGQVTALGKIMCSIPCNPSAAKAILLGSMFRCLDPLVYYGAQLEDSQIIANAASTNAVGSVRKSLAGTTYDDNIADARAFFGYDCARRSRDMRRAKSLKDEMFLRHDTYREISQISNQIVETLTCVLGQQNVPNEAETPVPYLYPHTPLSLNANSSNYNLVKALAMSTAGSRLAVWRRKDWTASTHLRILPSPRSVNHTSTKRSVREQRLTRENGDVLVYNVLRILPKDKYPWACDTSIVPPLSAILFAESVRLVDGDKLVINDWASYTIQTPSGHNQQAAKIILEYRKALDRFLNVALEKISLRPHRLQKVIEGEMEADEFNVYLREEDHPHRKIIVDSVIDILAIEAKDRDARLEIRKLDAEAAEGAVSPSSADMTASEQTTNAATSS